MEYERIAALKIVIWIIDFVKRRFVVFKCRVNGVLLDYSCFDRHLKLKSYSKAQLVAPR